MGKVPRPHSRRKGFYDYTQKVSGEKNRTFTSQYGSEGKSKERTPLIIR